MEKKEVISKKSSGINSNILKIFACACMLCDHVGLVLMDNNSVMRAIGRIAFPIFVFLLVEGYRHTSNVKKYILRLFVFALISEVPFDLAFSRVVFDIKNQNVFFTLAAGLTVIYLLDFMTGKSGITNNLAAKSDSGNSHRMDSEKDNITGRRNSFVDKYGIILAFAIIVVIVVMSELLNFDYGICGIIIIVLFYKITPAYGNTSLTDKIQRNVLVTILSGIIYFLFYGMKEMYAVLSIIPISFYNGKRGKKNKPIQYAFYAFYPVHLLCIYLIYEFIMWFIRCICYTFL